MNKNSSMSYYFNKISDLIKNRVYVDSGPLEIPKAKNSSIKDVKAVPEIKNEIAGNNEINKEENVNCRIITHNEKYNEININSLKPELTSSDNYIESEFNLLSSEKYEYEDKIILRLDEYDYEGHCVVTNYRFLYKPNIKLLKQCLKNPFTNFPDDYFDVPHYLISKIEKSQDKKNLSNYVLDIQTKDNRFIKLVINNNSKKFYGNLASFIGTKNIEDFMKFSMNYREHHPVNNDGWYIYDLITEFKRQGLNLNDENISRYTNKMRLSFVNEKFDFCSSYPEILVVPISVTDEELKELASFRTKSRIPTLCFYNSENDSSIWRSSQTKSGLTYSRNEKDEKLLQAIYESNQNCTKKTNKLMIYDARPYLNALANRFKGAGFENTDYYKNAEISFCEIDNIHCVRNALIKINTLVCNPKFIDTKNFFTHLEASTWTHFIYQIIKSAVDIAISIKNGNSVLIHCSDGWDRSSQLTSLSQLLIDPFYRSFEGFMILIEKEWLSFGHQFGLRNGFYNIKDHSEDQRAPIFLQWLDCVHQLLFHFPHLFEFNLDFLIFLAFHLNSCKYGTFLFNSEFQRNEKNAKQKTVSIWTDIIDNRHVFINPFYNSETLNDKNFKYLLPNFAIYKIRFWEEYFLRYTILNNNFGRLYKNKKEKINLNNENVNEENKNISANKFNVYSNICSKTSKYKSNIQFIELEKLRDLKTIQTHKDEINKLNGIVKEISTKIIFKISDFDELSEEAKNYLKEMNRQSNNILEEEDGYVIVKKYK